MAVNRFVVDVVTPEPLSRREYTRKSKEINDFAHTIAFDEVEGVEPNAAWQHGHQHVSTEERMCDTCVAVARDGRN